MGAPAANAQGQDSVLPEGGAGAVGAHQLELQDAGVGKGPWGLRDWAGGGRPWARVDTLKTTRRQQE